jgi:hypothetical protein
VETSAKILIVGGVLSLATAYAFGFVMTNARLKNPGAPQTLLLSDQFAPGPKPLGYTLAAINAMLVSIGLVIYLIGGLTGL